MGLPLPAIYLGVLTVLCERLPLSEVNWALTGSVGHRLQGVDVEVHDIDVQTDTDSAEAVAQRLGEYVVTRLRPRVSARIRSVFGVARIDGVTVEIMGGMRKRTGTRNEWGPPTDPAEHRVLVHCAGLAVPVLSLRYEAVAYEQIGRSERAAALWAAIESSAAG